ncbi:hypothetical protein [Legionella sp. km772]|uniref:hypothetical protein n=1 Tax=Legionella sp. km772 TaxID=2498111 RepID=UPI000F8D734B|nr:hypothetical protein [Legionella sp. km772]RUR09053.1 hypothetical protein ELY15_09785 [Legionella sp. km772]
MALTTEQNILKDLLPAYFWSEANFQPAFALSLSALRLIKDDELEPALAALNSSSLDKKVKKSIWIIMAESHPKLTDERLIDLGRQVGLANDELFQSALLLKDKAPFNQLLTYFEQQDMLSSLIKERGYSLFRWAAQEGELKILHYLAEKKPSAIPAMIASANFEAFKQATQKGHVHVVKFITEKAGIHLESMLASDNYDAFLGALEANSNDVVTHLLSYPQLLAHAEEHENTYNAHVLPFIDSKIISLREQKNKFELDHPRGVFDVSISDAKLLFYCLRNLIRRNDPSLHDQMLFLLEIPAVKNLVHQEITEDKPNELLRLALVKNNRSAINLLIGIPAVHDLAAQNNYYQDELRGAINLRALASDRESSMTALNQGEQDCLKQVTEHYDAQLKHLGISGVMNELRETLKTRYTDNPAFIISVDADTGKPVKTNLPMEWEAFQDLHLSTDDYARALTAYYQHSEHSAWRYLLKPNPWMHEKAHYVYTNADNEKEKWAAFEEYQALIALLYLAAKDRDIAPIEGYTVETRIEQFIKELALIARAHNWDQERFKLASNGEILLDDDHNPIMEEYDDLEADRPSCYSGVKRRLFQSVQGHPLLVLLTTDKINAELYDFARKHFANLINDSNRIDFKRVWNKVIAGNDLTDADLRILKSADFSLEKQKEFIQFLAEKYERQFTENPYFTKKIMQAFMLNNINDAHLLNFGYTHPEHFFVKEKGSAPVFFEPASAKDEESEVARSVKPKMF